MDVKRNIRVAYLIAANDLQPQNRSGLRAAKFCKLAGENDAIVDLILDDTPPEVSMRYGKMIGPKEPTSRDNHEEIFGNTRALNIESATDFHKATMLAFQNNLYDAIVVTNPEALAGVYNLDFASRIPLVYWEGETAVDDTPYSHIREAIKKADNVIVWNYEPSHLESWQVWRDLLTSFQGMRSNSKAGKINTWTEGFYHDFIASLKRFASSEDIHTVLNNRHKFNIHYTADGTWMEAKEKPSERNEDFLSMFEFPKRK